MKLVRINAKALRACITGYCLHYGLTQKDIADRIGVDASVLRAWMRGKSAPRETYFKRLREWLEQEGLLIGNNLQIIEPHDAYPRLGRKPKYERVKDISLVL